MSTSSLTIGMLQQQLLLLRGGRWSLSRQTPSRSIPSSTTTTTTTTKIQTRNVHESPKYAYLNLEKNKAHQNATSQKTALILGSSGILGRNIVQHLSHNLQMTVIGADLIDPVNKRDADALDAFIPLENESGSAVELCECLSLGMKECCGVV
eukprot:CAMPEP_0185726184 /NCGR_PEP_ID=MMETSP1171-20130828/2247_1 /TAXON_ID=374046 /ORGANISM="Helicotheca tamensis, Strain CCMP826" /LENGTH=151 /DNA_ID=CAMNT_0028394487 /DNA_START=191 /DNA_END=646 /DNA_ORIENTATION=-